MGDRMPTQRRLANAIRALAMDAVEAANSGHPGMPMGMDAATALFTRHLKYDPADPHWPDRDRFVLSAGHGSMLIYALLLTGMRGRRSTTSGISASFQPCAGHPENFMLPGSKRRPARWARASPRRSAWRLPSGTSTPSMATIWSITAPCAGRRRLPDGRRQP